MMNEPIVHKLCVGRNKTATWILEDEFFLCAASSFFFVCCQFNTLERIQGCRHEF